MMKSRGIVFSICLLAPLAVMAADAGQTGRYQGVEASETAVWVIDTQTGRVRKCTQEFSDTPPSCSQFSE